MIRHSDRLLTALLAALLLWAPLPFGGAVPWAEAGLRVLAFTALALAMVAVDRLSALRAVAVPAAALAGVALLGLLQSLSWPAGLAAFVSPEHARLFGDAGSLLEEPLAPAAPRLTLAASASRSVALQWAAAAALLLAGAVAGRERLHRRVLGGALVAGALFQVIFGARGWFARSREIWGVEVTSNPARLRGTFVNSNHLALYLGIGLAFAFAWVWWTARRAAEEPQPERRVAIVAPPVLVWLTLFAGLAFTGSRAGLLAAVAAVSFQGLLLARTGQRRRLALLGVGAAGLGLGVVAFLGFREGLGRMAATSIFDVSLGARLDAYRAALDLWWRFPVTGTGLGTFRDAFPLVQPTILEGTWWHAHSDLLEVPVTTGVVGLALVAAGVWALARRLLAVLREGRRSEDRAAALALLGALAGIAVHEALDFGLTMPANALTLAVVVGSAVAARTGRVAAQTAGARQPSQGLSQAAGSAQGDAPRQGTAEERLDLEEMKPGADDRAGKKDRGQPVRRAARRHRKRS
jgi:O-antigen ligase